LISEDDHCIDLTNTVTPSSNLPTLSIPNNVPISTPKGIVLSKCFFY